MATASRPKLMTAEESMAADLGEGRFELVRGEVIEVPPPMPDHARVTMKTGFALESFGRSTGFGYCLSESAIATERGPDTVRGPDLLFYSHARWPKIQLGPSLPPLPPDLAVEVVSPSNRGGAILQKVGEYLQAGVTLVWVVHPKKRYVAVYRPDEDEPTYYREGDILEGFPELLGFRCPVSDLFPPAPPQ
jgi:Uma2 family endonuclease